VAFTATGERCQETVWRDVTAEFPSQEPSDEVQVIQPGAVRECREDEELSVSSGQQATRD
jgi:hypothetical protein